MNFIQRGSLFVVLSGLMVPIWQLYYTSIPGEGYITRQARIRSGQEIGVSIQEDRDSDGLSDKDEIMIYQSNPEAADSDKDGFNDLSEVINCYDPNSQDNPGQKVSNELSSQWKFKSELFGSGLNVSKEVNGIYLNEACHSKNDGAIYPIFKAPN